MCGLNIQPSPLAFLLCVLLLLPCLNSPRALHVPVHLGHLSMPGEASVNDLTFLLAHMLSLINIPNPVVLTVCHSRDKFYLPMDRML